MAITDPNHPALLKSLMEALNSEMTLAAEPFIQNSLKEIENEMRKKLASMLIAYIDKNLSIERVGADLRIIIKQAY